MTTRVPRNGLSHTPEYQAWADMLRRCLNPWHKSFQYYGGRGIKVCKRWGDFEAFLEDMGPRPEGKSFDRIDVDGNYQPGNCRWATWSEQQRNKRNNRYVEFAGERLLLCEWAEIYDVPAHVLRSRLSYGWDVKRALTTEVQHRRRKEAAIQTGRFDESKVFTGEELLNGDVVEAYTPTGGTTYVRLSQKKAPRAKVRKETASR